MRFRSSINDNSICWQTLPSTQDLFTTISRRYSHAACYYGMNIPNGAKVSRNQFVLFADNYMYVFGGCTSTNTTFNDLWKLNLSTRTWVRPLPTGSYPSPKACATLVCYKDSLILYGGWTQSSSSPLHQVIFKINMHKRITSHDPFLRFVNYLTSSTYIAWKLTNGTTSTPIQPLRLRLVTRQLYMAITWLSLEESDGNSLWDSLHSNNRATNVCKQS